MLIIFGFNELAIALGDLYFADPNARPGQEGAERGVRLELRWLELCANRGSLYASRAVTLGRPVWRADLLESVAAEPGSLDRTHHHPKMNGWESGPRYYEPEMSADPIAWLRRVLSDPVKIFQWAELPAPSEGDIEGIAQAAPRIANLVEELMTQVRSGKLAQVPPDIDAKTGIRVGWL